MNVTWWVFSKKGRRDCEDLAQKFNGEPFLSMLGHINRTSCKAFCYVSSQKVSVKTLRIQVPGIY